MVRRRRWFHLPVELRREIMRLAAQGLNMKQIGQRVDVSSSAVTGALRPFGGLVQRDMLEVVGNHLSLTERVEIRIGIERALSFRAIAKELGRPVSTISREVNGKGGRSDYGPVAAHVAARERTRRPKPTKLAANPALCARVIADLEHLFSPQQIAATLAIEFGDDMTMRVSHETIYKSLYVQGRGELRRELARCLRTGRATRKPKGRIETRGQIIGMVNISARPPEVADRAVPGHWEGDLIIGKDTASAIGTLVERSSRFVMLLHLPGDHKADTVREAMTKKIATLPEQLLRSITWDQGNEMAGHARFTIDTGIQIYFCDPHSPWQRGSNENTNGLLRQYFPKGTDLSVHSESDLDAAAASLNSRPRQTLGWVTPSKKLAELVAATA